MDAISKMETLCIGVRCQTMTTHELRMELTKMRPIMFNDTMNSPHPIIQSDYIVLWANVDIYYAMNYVLCGFCTELDEIAVVTLLKQLTVFSLSDDVHIIKAIWDAILCNNHLRHAALHCEKRNVASYSLRSLSVYHHNFDPKILTTLMKLLKESMDANQRITLATYVCVIQRLGKIPKDIINSGQISAIHRIWGKSTVMLTDCSIDIQRRHRELWMGLMLQICWDFKFWPLAKRVRAFYNCTYNRRRNSH